ncbi:adenosylcobinamide amidohydrolase [Paenibacillus sp. UNC499MF]|uniref:adenosylcobinamide amidohydrolase n=1 Tax=Paenibacillus sp. UNC499MF TaxID=1502751 RepID=UPI00089FE2E9|nr:adenosylcobinamide amidohydrolase [Paenibacillus sp. UNC499MF]SEG73381.1 Adenosylcobinamide amidohydrolase [Paenibacillus sp. UNC499MF]
MNTPKSLIYSESRPAAGITAGVNGGEAGSYLLLESLSPLRTLSSAPWGGGFGYHRTIINRKVDKTYACGNPVTEMNEFLGTVGLNSEETACLLTSVHMSGLGESHLRMDDPVPVTVTAGVTGFDSCGTSEGKPDAPAEARKAHRLSGAPDARPGTLVTGGAGLPAGAGKGAAESAAAIAADTGIAVSAWVTVGYSNMARAGRGLPASALFPGTINIIVAVEGELTDEAMVNAVITATEAKAAALQDLGVALEDGSGATGTTTDAVLIAATQKGRVHRYAGTATYLGHMIGRSVYEAAMQSGLAYKKALALP